MRTPSLDPIRRSLPVAAIVLSLAGLVPPAFAGVPVNDDCAGALSAVVGTTPYDVPGSATLDPTAPPPSEPAMLADVWFTWTAPADGAATISTCEGAAGDDTTLEVYAGGCGTLASLASDDDTPGCGQFGFSSTVTLPVTEGTEYSIRVGGWNGNPASGLLEIVLTTDGACCLPSGLCITLDETDCDVAGGTFGGIGASCVGFACPPSNDDCADALPIVPGETLTGSTVAATVEPGIPAAGCDGVSITAPGVWFRTVGTGGTFTASLCDPLTSYDTKLHVFCADCGAFTCVAANDDDPTCPVNPLRSTVSWCTQPGIEYLILVSGFSTATGNFALALDDDGIACAGAPDCGGYELRLEPTDDCYDADDGPIVIEVVLDGDGAPAYGGQFFLEYDAAVLQLVSAEPGDAPFDFEIYECSTVSSSPPQCAPVAGSIDYAVGVDPAVGGPGAPAGVMARFIFLPLASTCDPESLVRFRAGPLPSRVTDDLGLPLGPTLLVDAPDFTIDVVPPTITFCPPDLLVPADAGFCSAALAIPFVEATDDCDTPSLSFLRSDDPFLGLNDRFPVGVTTITWFAVDDCGNVTTCTTEIEVLPTSELELVVELAPNLDTGGAFPQTLVRCLEIELARPGCTGPATVEVEVAFTIIDQGPLLPNLAVGTATVDVPCGPWSCLSIRDPLHTLRSVNAGFGVSGGVFVADVTGPEALVGGELNGDGVIDILDFGAFVFTFGTDYGTGDTTCATAEPHGDVSGDGFVGAEDFSFIQVHFLEFGDPACCPVPLPQVARGDATRPDGDRRRSGPARALGATPGGGPVTSITIDELRRRGLGHLAAADLDGNGRVDGRDLALWPQQP